MIASLALSGCGSGAKRQQVPSGRSTTTRTTTTPKPPPLPRSLLRLRRELQHELARAGKHSGAAVYDLGAGADLFSLRDGIGRPPASVEKLYTTVALAQKLGPAARLHTIVLGVGHMGPRGVWHGSLYLKGGGDPTFGDGRFNRIWLQGHGPTAFQLAQAIRRRGMRRVTGPLIGDASLFDRRPGGPASAFAPDIPDFGGQLSALTFDHGSTTGTLAPGAFAARQLARTLRTQHVQVRASALTSVTPRRARKLASVSSPPLSVMLKLMDVPSDDLFAEMLTEQLGSRFGRAGTIAAGARVISNEIRTYGIHPKIVDGSGLSRTDRSSPAQVVELLRDVWQTPVGRLLTASLPVVGVSGTVSSLAGHTAAHGRCFAKTGTLTDVTNLAGYCAAHGHHRIAFALFIDGPSNSRARTLLDHMIGAIAAY